MAGALHDEFPDSYRRCDNCRGTGVVRCRSCDGEGWVVGPDRYLYAGRIGRRFGMKVCTSCHGGGGRTCGLCVSGSVRRA